MVAGIVGLVPPGGSATWSVRVTPPSVTWRTTADPLVPLTGAFLAVRELIWPALSFPCRFPAERFPIVPVTLIVPWGARVVTVPWVRVVAWTVPVIVPIVTLLIVPEPGVASATAMKRPA